MFTKLLAVTGTLLVWFPLLAPIILALVLQMTRGKFLLDYLMPAELFPAVLIGGGLLIWAAFRAQVTKKLLVWSLSIAVLSLVGAQAFAEISGIASGARPAAGWPWLVLIGTLILFLLSVLATGIGGLRLLRKILAVTK